MKQIKFELRKLKNKNSTLAEKYIVIDYFDKYDESKEFKKYKSNYIEFVEKLINYIDKGYEIKVFKLDGK